MRKGTRALVGAIVASLVATAVSVYAQTPTEVDFAACNTNARAPTKPGTATAAKYFEYSPMASSVIAQSRNCLAAALPLPRLVRPLASIS